MQSKTKNLIVIEELDEHRYEAQCGQPVKGIHKSLEKSLENLEKIEAEWRKFKEFSTSHCLKKFPRTKKDSNLHAKLAFYTRTGEGKAASNKFIAEPAENSSNKKPKTKFFTPKSSPKISNHLEPIRFNKKPTTEIPRKPAFDFPETAAARGETPRRLTQIKVKLEKMLPGSERGERTKSFNVDFRAENESFRATTPQPMPLMTARGDFQSPGKSMRSNTMINNNGYIDYHSPTKTVPRKETGKPLSELVNAFTTNQPILENNINIKVNITVNQRSSRETTKKPPTITATSLMAKSLDQRLIRPGLTVKKPILGENQSRKPMIEGVLKSRKEKNTVSKPLAKQLKAKEPEKPPLEKTKKEEGEHNNQVQKLMDNLIKLKNDTNKLYNSYNTMRESKKAHPQQNPFENLYNEIITKLKKESTDKPKK